MKTPFILISVRVPPHKVEKFFFEVISCYFPPRIIYFEMEKRKYSHLRKSEGVSGPSELGGSLKIK